MFLYWVVRYQENPDFRRKTSISQIFLVGVILYSAVEITDRAACKAGEDIRKVNIKLPEPRAQTGISRHIIICELCVRSHVFRTADVFRLISTDALADLDGIVSQPDVMRSKNSRNGSFRTRLQEDISRLASPRKCQAP